MTALQIPPGRDGRSLLWISIPVPNGAWARPAIFLGAVSIAFEAYADGELRYRSGELDPEGYETEEHASWHLVRLPKSVMGKRVLLRIQSSGKSIGVRRDVQVGEEDVLLTRALASSMGAFLQGSLMLALGVIAALGFLLRRREAQLAGLALFALSGGVITVFMSGVPSALWGVGGQKLVHLGVFFAIPALWAFVDATILEARRRWFTVVGRVFLGTAAVLASIVVTVHGALPHIFPIYLLLIVATLLVCVVVTAQEASRGNGDARLLALGMSVLFLAALVTALTSLGVLRSIGVVLHWGLLGLTLSLLGVIARRSQAVIRTLEAQTRSLTEGKEKVQQLASRMGTGATELLTVVQQLRTSAANQHDGVTRQAAALRQAQATVEELRQTSRVTAEKAMEVAASASGADEAGHAGTETLAATMTSLEAIRAEVGEMARRIQGLDAHTREIAGIVETVKGLADQSNMLALNAAIEAVRSGEHGKGFGVVAREVRSLADQSIEATARIRDILATLSSSTREVAELSRSGEERVRSSLDEVRASGDQLRKLATLARETGGSVRTITTAVAQQDAGTNQIATAIGDLSAQMQRTLEAVRQTEEVSRSVQRLAEGLSDGVVAVAPRAAARA